LLKRGSALDAGSECVSSSLAFALIYGHNEGMETGVPFHIQIFGDTTSFYSFCKLFHSRRR